MKKLISKILFFVAAIIALGQAGCRAGDLGVKEQLVNGDVAVGAIHNQSAPESVQQ